MSLKPQQELVTVGLVAFELQGRREWDLVGPSRGSFKLCSGTGKDDPW